MFRIDLNCDLGESFGAYTIGLDKEVIKYVSSANIACGFHASDPLTMSNTVKLAADAGAGLGAHPGFPDLLGFGRRNMTVSPAEAKAYIQYQVGALSAFAAANGKKLSHVKPHGALYNMAGKDISLATAINTGLKFAREVFADRAYENDGSLVARSKPGSMITDENEAVARVIRMVKEKKVRTIDGTDIDITADSVCVHGDNAHALEFVKKIRAALTDAGIEIAPLSEIIK